MTTETTFDDLPKLEINSDGYVSISVPGAVILDQHPPVLMRRLVRLQPSQCEALATMLLKCASIAREIGPVESATESSTVASSTAATAESSST
jgi:hypothetical protein